MFNRIVLVGRLTAKPELRTTQSGIAVATFTIAVERRYKNANGEKEADFIDIVTWRGIAENCAKYLDKGSAVVISGSLQIRNYEDKNGNKRKAAEVVADEVRFITPAKNKQDKSGRMIFTNGDGEQQTEAREEALFDDDLPF